MNQFCVHVRPGDCNVVEIVTQPFSETITVMLDESKTVDLADYGLPWTYTPTVYQDYCGDLEYFIDYTACTEDCDEWITTFFD